MLEIDGVSKRYGDVRALTDMGFTVRPGELFGFVGANGAGKTTTMRIILGVLVADSGEVPGVVATPGGGRSPRGHPRALIPARSQGRTTS